MLNPLSRGPSAHLLWAELACHDEPPTAYPIVWRDDRAVTLAVTFEDVRQMLGSVSITILSGYRTEAYNQTVEGSAQHSQHVQGRALDIWHPKIQPREVFRRIRMEQLAGHLPLLGGLGIYRTFVHMDVRPKMPKGHVAMWAGAGTTIPA